MKKKMLLAVAALVIAAGQSAFAATTLDFRANACGSSPFCSGSLNVGVDLYTSGEVQPAGSGVIHSFVRLDKGAGNTGFESGYNTDARPVTGGGGSILDVNTSPTFTRSLLVSDVPIVTIGGVQYRQFLLDINQTNSDPILTLNRVIITLRSAGNLTGANAVEDTRFTTGNVFNSGTQIYDSGQGNKVQLNYMLESGSGQSDMFLYVKSSLFTGPNNYVYLYSEFGSLAGDPTCNDVGNPVSTCYANNNDGYEEWAVRDATTTTPEPTSLVLLGMGFMGMAAAKAKARKSQKD